MEIPTVSDGRPDAESVAIVGMGKYIICVGYTGEPYSLKNRMPMARRSEFTSADVVLLEGTALRLLLI